MQGGGNTWNRTPTRAKSYQNEVVVSRGLFLKPTQKQQKNNDIKRDFIEECCHICMAVGISDLSLGGLPLLLLKKG